MKKKSILSKFISLLVFFVLLVLLFIISEIIYQTRHNTDAVAYFYFKKVPVYNMPSPFWHLLNKSTAKTLYTYLSEVEARTPDDKVCGPFCLDYDAEQEYLDLFKKLLSVNATKNLNDVQMKNLYLWMATLNIFHKESDKITLEWLKIGLSTETDPNFRTFYEELGRTNSMNLDPTNNSYFIERLDKVDPSSTPRYQKIYLARASYNLAVIALKSGDNGKAKEYIIKSLSFNEYNIDYYLFLSELYRSEGDTKTAIKILQTCITKVPKDSQLCADKI